MMRAVPGMTGGYAATQAVPDLEARRRLLHSDERVDVIAERVGYADPTHFIRMFRREHGATPAAWRAAQARGRPTAPRPPRAPGRGRR